MDNSESLDAGARRRVISKVNAFLAPLLASQLDYHVGVVTSDPADAGALRAFDGAPVEGCASCRFLTPAVACADVDVDVTGLSDVERDALLAERCEAWLVLANMLRAGDPGGAAERTFDMALAALANDAPLENEGFRRAQAPLHILFISDENEGEKADGTPVRFYERAFDQLAGAGNEALVTTSSLVGIPAAFDEATRAELCTILQGTDARAVAVRETLRDVSQGCFGGEDDATTFAEPGARYVDLICRTGGIIGDLCADDFAPTMAAVAALVLDRCVEGAGACLGNVQCDEGLMCDASTSSCAAEVDCLRDGHCAIGSICEGTSCVQGCVDNADCPPDQGCVAGACVVVCLDAGECDGGEVCVNGACVRDPRGACEPCSASCELPSLCRTDSAGFSYCAPDCTSGEACPAQFECSDIIITPPSAPFCNLPETCEGGQCSRNTSASCVVDTDCPEGSVGGDCHVQTNGRFGSCTLDDTINCVSDADCVAGDTCKRIECRGDVGDTFGHCSCTRDSDCPVDVCIGADISNPNDPINGHCELSGRPCFENFECDVIACVDGGCLLGAVCAPANGEPCRDVLAE